MSTADRRGVWIGKEVEGRLSGVQTAFLFQGADASDVPERIGQIFCTREWIADHGMAQVIELCGRHYDVVVTAQIPVEKAAKAFEAFQLDRPANLRVLLFTEGPWLDLPLAPQDAVFFLRDSEGGGTVEVSAIDVTFGVDYANDEEWR